MSNFSKDIALTSFSGYMAIFTKHITMKNSLKNITIWKNLIIFMLFLIFFTIFMIFLVNKKGEMPPLLKTYKIWGKIF